ncbi:MAG: hypothetical protein ACR2FS_05805 [Phormidesmis sp.]
MSESVQEKLAVQSTADSLKKQGYAVVVEPDPSIIPFDLHQYRPSILATRNDENLIVDIKLRGTHRSIERYKEISDIVGNHKNWRFMLSTVDEIEPIERSLTEDQANPRSLNSMLSRLDPLLTGENYDLALPYLWSVYISAIRIVGKRAGVPIDATSDRSVLNYMYSLGEISNGEYDWAQAFLAIRNKAVHSLEVTVSKEAMLEMYSHTKQKLLEWELV